MRPSLKIRHDSSATLHLGRNVSTGIAFGEIPRKAATVLFKKSGKFHLERHSSHVSVIRRDGSVVPLSGPLEHDDVVRLYKQDYAYRVQLSTETENTTTKENSMVFQETGEECACAVCMEIIVNATALVPCGHLFCKDCLNNISECPNCRLPVQSKLPIKTMDNVIGKLVTAGNVFSEEDVQHYASRTKPPDVVVAPVCKVCACVAWRGVVYCIHVLACIYGYCILTILSHCCCCYFRSHVLPSELDEQTSM